VVDIVLLKVYDNVEFGVEYDFPSHLYVKWDGMWLILGLSDDAISPEDVP